jgi:sulfatase modifying factor 1
MKSLKVIGLVLALSVTFSPMIVKAQDKGFDTQNYYPNRDEEIKKQTKIIESNPKDVDAYARRARSYAESGKLDLAIADFSSALKITDKYEDFYFERAEIYAAKKRFDLAIADLTIYIKKASADWGYKLRGYMLRGEIYAYDNKFDLALADFNVAAKLVETETSTSIYKDTEFRVYYLRGQIYVGLKRFDPAIADFRKAEEKAINANGRYEAAVAVGNTYNNQNKFDSAVAEYSRAIDNAYKSIKERDRHTGTIYSALLGRGIAYIGLSKYDLALTDLTRAIPATDNAAEVFYWRGQIYSAQGKYDLADADFSEGIKLSTGDQRALLEKLKAENYRKMGTSPAAVTGKKKAIETGDKVEKSPTKPATTPTGQKNPAAGTIRKNSIGMELVYIPPGAFMMGSSESDIDKSLTIYKRYNKTAERSWISNQTPQRKVTIKEGFWMGKYEVTQEQWRLVMGTTVRQQRDNFVSGNALAGEGANYPMYFVSWDEAKQFVRRLNEKNDGFIYSLPSEAQWEYAARGGTSTLNHWGDDLSNTDICRYANINDLSRKPLSHVNYHHLITQCNDGFAETAPVGSFRPNGFGLFDMIGNVTEWCEDTYLASYSNLPTDGSANGSISSEGSRVFRGGGFGGNATVTSANRSSIKASARATERGFRIVVREK